MATTVTQLKNTTTHYGWVSIAFHWLMALTIIGMYPFGLYIVSLGYYDPGYRIYPDLHRSIGVLVAFAWALRLTWRLFNPRPVPLSPKPWERMVGHIVHAVLYGLIAVVVASGYLITTADGRSVDVFGWFSIPAIPALATRQEELWGNVHFYAATTMIVLVALHMAAALKHHFINKDATLTRMFGMKTGA
ncbi:MAG: cytochrome b [Idiomarina sp.]|nr:cytochrome b [Idiomarina sp.]